MAVPVVDVRLLALVLTGRSWPIALILPLQHDLGLCPGVAILTAVCEWRSTRFLSVVRQ